MVLEMGMCTGSCLGARAFEWDSELRVRAEFFFAGRQTWLTRAVKDYSRWMLRLTEPRFVVALTAKE